ncbi:MAG: glycerol-3-phosphate 1-O-acyltransferase PlsY [Planctomycetaceae bacterium]|nr:glycerol-3-phosphate 1-O-acyltransferase PlsY [Planctomycetaceae bacterium]
MSVVFGCLVGFLIGGIPFGYLLGRSLLKDDIRNHGSGNIGATNVARVIGWKWGAVVLVLDALKGMLPTWAAVAWAQQNQPQLQYHLAVATGISAIVGHMYPVYLRLRGGKGVATALGVVLVLGPQAVLAAFVVFATIAFTTRLIGLASMLAALTYGGCQLYLLRGVWLTSDKWSLTLFSVAIPLLIIWRHRSNIMRMIKGTEPPISESARPQDATGDHEQPTAQPSDSDSDTRS